MRTADLTLNESTNICISTQIDVASKIWRQIKLSKENMGQRFHFIRESCHIPEAVNILKQVAPDQLTTQIRSNLGTSTVDSSNKDPFCSFIMNRIYF